MKIALIHTFFDNKHLDEVVEEMRVLGPPRLRAIWLEDKGMWAALEGCHRTRAAARLGLEPIIVPVTYRRGMSWQECDMGNEPISVLSEWTVDDVVRNAGKELVVGFGVDGPPPRSEIRKPKPGEIMKYRVIDAIGFDFNGQAIDGFVGRIITSDEAPYDLTPWVALGHLQIVEDEPVKVTKETRQPPKMKGAGKVVEVDGVPRKECPHGHQDEGGAK